MTRREQFQLIIDRYADCWWWYDFVTTHEGEACESYTIIVGDIDEASRVMAGDAMFACLPIKLEEGGMPHHSTVS